MIRIASFQRLGVRGLRSFNAPFTAYPSSIRPLVGTHGSVCSYCSSTASMNRNESASEETEMRPSELPSNLYLDDASILSSQYEQDASHKVEGSYIYQQDGVPVPMEVMVDLSKGGKSDLQLPIYHFSSGSPSGEHIQVNQTIAETPLRRDIIHRVVLWQQANRRKGYFEAKQRGEVAGSGIKLRPQKGLGMARVGEARVPGRIGGPKAHPPRVRDWTFSVPKKVRRYALRSTLNYKLWNNQLMVVDALQSDSHKTKDIKPVLEQLNISEQMKRNRTLFVDSQVDDDAPFTNAIRNLKHLDLITDQKLNVLDMLKVENVVMTKQAFDNFQHRITRYC
eukprot:gb/GECG01009916.1/.p1 GENE.gb/GECG01009916.1/~~gb/GECG01009916.1/.p1  ORF type:complete len:337 (+),score=30.89 gb/GECG01009916.1/:1-1011(+)